MRKILYLIGFVIMTFLTCGTYPIIHIMAKNTRKRTLIFQLIDDEARKRGLK